MRKALFFLTFLYFSYTNLLAQNNDVLKIKILNNIFSNCKLVKIESDKYIETTARNKFASIPIKDSHFKLIKLSEKLLAIAFSIYLSENKHDYKEMLKKGLYNFMDLEKNDTLNRLKENERLIQVLLYDIKNNRFIAKANGFPLEGLKWLPEGMGDLTQFENISYFKAIPKGINSWYLEMSECPDCQNAFYFFKFLKPSEIVSSEKKSACFELIWEEKNKIIVDEITNCYEHEYDGAQAIYNRIEILEWFSK